MTKLAEQHRCDQPFDIYTLFKCFTMDTIWSCGFGLDTDMQNNPNDPYLIQSQRVAAEESHISPLIILLLFIPELKWLWNGLQRCDGSVRYWLTNYLPITRRFISDDVVMWFENQTEQLIKKRIELGYTKRMDLLQLMLESVSDDDFIQDQPTSTVANTETTTEPPLVRKLTKHEIAANIALFMIAGYETTSTALSYIAYALATHPNEQRKLQEHIDAHFDFYSRREFPFADPHAKTVALFTASGLRWKRQRFVINPTFSSLKLKQMSPLINRNIDSFMTKLAEQHRCDQPFDIYTLFKRFTMDTI
ncbi:unnamed protein product [Rotaria sordida]|uniref:Cytochrome P450 n=1 Tax=Rotaria sordida TaxID=392033 RepID=A0A815QI32_9BILA|nr:unnamed protein product [Rotaria sordida]